MSYFEPEKPISKNISQFKVREEQEIKMQESTTRRRFVRRRLNLDEETGRGYMERVYMLSRRKRGVFDLDEKKVESC